MFVWECLKTDGKHLGMCMDGFMFGSCCVHEDSNNNVKTSLMAGNKEKEIANKIDLVNTNIAEDKTEDEEEEGEENYYYGNKESSTDLWTALSSSSREV